MREPIFKNKPEGIFNWTEGNYPLIDRLNSSIDDYKLFTR
jgi:hypothetical protein